MSFETPLELRTNAWDGEAPVLFDFPADAGPQVEVAKTWLAPPNLAKPWDWRSRDVGWGLVLHDDDDLTHEEKVAGVDAPGPIRRLLAARAPAPILRYQPNKRAGQLIRYNDDGTADELATAAPNRGIRRGQIPQYLLIYATPDVIPWSVQYSLNLSAFVGRLDLTEEEGLGDYVDALVSNWAGHPVADARRPLVWSVDWGPPDVTHLLSALVGSALAGSFEDDEDLSERMWLTGKDATTSRLAKCLSDDRPGFICTTSHGMTGPLTDAVTLQAQLGSPVDANKDVLQLDQLRGWSPGGAIWYSHACCSAGSDRFSRFADLIGPDERGGVLLRQIGELAGRRVAPLPRLLLGAKNPLAAFVGHVEPTFDWTLRDPLSKQEVTHTIISCLYDRLFTAEHPAPIGWALASIFAEAGYYFGLAADSRKTDNRPAMEIHRKLVAIDRQNLVILGDPTVTVHPGAAN